jgi:hypothetical protein
MLLLHLFYCLPSSCEEGKQPEVWFVVFLSSAVFCVVCVDVKSVRGWHIKKMRKKGPLSKRGRQQKNLIFPSCSGFYLPRFIQRGNNNNNLEQMSQLPCAAGVKVAAVCVGGGWVRR